MEYYRTTKDHVTAEDAYEVAMHALQNPDLTKKGIRIVATNKRNAAIMLHAANEFGLRVEKLIVRDREMSPTVFMRQSRKGEWTNYMKAVRKANKEEMILHYRPQIEPATYITEAKEIAPAPHLFNYCKPLAELNAMTGLREVKIQINGLANYLKIKTDRRRMGLPEAAIGQHLVMTGNPGTGKTTIARYIGHIYRDLGILDKGHFIEIGARDLIAEYIGQTAAKTAEIVKKAIDGILFIDEAYALVPKDSYRDFGPEAIATLIKYMEDYRTRLVVIIAGYDYEITKLLETNPGMKSRFKTKIHFPDYDQTELAEIFECYCKEQQYILTPEAKGRVEALCEELHRTKGQNFGNGRTVRNAYEKAIMKQAERLASTNKRLKKQELQTFHAADIPIVKEFDW